MNELFHLLSSERHWSWSIVALVTIFIGIGLRTIFLKGILHSLKVRNRSWYRRTLTHYQKHSIFGWIFFATFVVGTVLFWLFEPFFVKRVNLFGWTMILIIVLILSIFFHLRAYTKSIIDAVEEHIATDKEI